MKTLAHVSLLTSALLLVGCNEKAKSPDVGTSGSSTSGGSGSGVGPGVTIVPPDEFYFRVNNSSSTLLKHHLHKTGSGNSSKNCEIKNTAGFASETYRANQSTYDITCFFEAEELSLYISGFGLEVEASKNTCDFVAYSPYGYYASQPGDSSTTLTHVKCMNDTTNAGHVSTAFGPAGTNTFVEDMGGIIGCNEMVDTGLTLGSRKSFTYNSDADLCHFNYGDKKCDIGVITVTEAQVTYTPATASAPAITKTNVVNRTVSCGGTPANCVKGPVKLHTDFPNATKVTEFYQPEVNKDFSKDYQFEGLIKTLVPSSIGYVNYRRDLASKNINYITSDISAAGVFVNGTYRSSFGNTTHGRTFDGGVMEAYSRSMLMNGTDLYSSAYHDSVSVYDDTYTARPLAAEPFVGVPPYQVNPFYTFHCLDTAMDIKARIKIAVRDWDRTFTVSSDLDWLTDLWKNPLAYEPRMDLPGVEEVDNDPDRFNPFNDRADFDDMIEMERTAGAYNAATTKWRPKPVILGPMNYSDGFFNPLLFPGH